MDSLAGDGLGLGLSPREVDRTLFSMLLGSRVLVGFLVLDSIVLSFQNGPSRGYHSGFK